MYYIEGNAQQLDNRKVFELVLEVQDITITRHTQDFKTYSYTP